MYTLLLDISKVITANTGVETTIYPFYKKSYKPQLVIKSKSLIKTERGAHKNRPEYKDTVDELSVDLILESTVLKSADGVEAFYQANESLNQYFLRGVSIDLGGIGGGAFKLSLLTDKLPNGGTYWEPLDEEGTNGFLMQEIWNGTIRMFNYK